MRRAVAYYATRDLIPLYGIYALLFSDHGLSARAISALFIVWSVTSFVFEVPSGAWADLVDRRLLLVLSSVVYAAGFIVWTLWPTAIGFALGFVLWGMSGALMSGTFEALLYDELVAQGAECAYARLLGWANSASMVATLAATASGGPLYAWGGYALVGWASVAAAAVHGVLAASLPAAPRIASTIDTIDTIDTAEGAEPTRATWPAQYAAMLRAGVRQATHHRVVRHVVLISAGLMGVSAYDEYFGLLARDTGAVTSVVPLLVALVVVGQVAGTGLAGRTAARSGRFLAILVATAGTLIAAGSLSGHPAGLVVIAIGYGLAANAIVVSEARLQAVIRGPARATATSAAGFAAEVFAVALYATFAIGSSWLPTKTLVAVLCLPLLGIAAAIRIWWPDATAEPEYDDDQEPPPGVSAGS